MGYLLTGVVLITWTAALAAEEASGGARTSRGVSEDYGGNDYVATNGGVEDQGKQTPWIPIIGQHSHQPVHVHQGLPYHALLDRGLALHAVHHPNALLPLTAHLGLFGGGKGFGGETYMVLPAASTNYVESYQQQPGEQHHHYHHQEPQHVEVPVPHPVAYPVPHPVPVPVPHAVPVRVPVPVPVPRNVAVPVERPVPVPVEKPYPLEIVRKIPVPVVKPYPVPFPVYKTKYIYHGLKHH